MKIVEVKKKRKIKKDRKYQEIISTKVRDQEGSYATITFWNGLCNYAKQDKIYKIYNLKVENFPVVKPHFLSTTSKTIITDVTETFTETFKDIKLYSTITGQYETSTEVKCYPSCKKCNTSLADSQVCWKCKGYIRDAYPNFVFNLYLKTEDGEYPRFFSYMSVLDKFLFDFANDSSEIQDQINEFFDSKMIKIAYMDKEDPKEQGVMQRHAISIDFAE